LLLAIPLDEFDLAALQGFVEFSDNGSNLLEFFMDAEVRF